MSFDSRFCCWSTTARSFAVSLPPSSFRMSRTSWFNADSFRSRRAVSRAVSWPLLTPWAMRSCWFSARFLIPPAVAEDGIETSTARASPAALPPMLLSLMSHLHTGRRLSRARGLRRGGAGAAFRHLEAPIETIHERHPVPAGPALEELREAHRRPEAPCVARLVRAQHVEEALVAHLPPQRVEHERPLAVQQAAADLGPAHRVVLHVDARR